MYKFILNFSIIITLFLFNAVLFAQNIVIIGPAGSGKGTQAEFLKKQHNLLHISSGDILRDYKKNPTNKYSKIINKYTSSGKLLPTKIINDILKDYINENYFNNVRKYNGILLDGYPRQIEQIKSLDDFLSKHNEKIDKVINLEISDETVIERLQKRNREDDKNIEVIKQRLKDFHDKTKLVLNEYKKRGIVINIDATQNSETINKLIEKHF